MTRLLIVAMLLLAAAAVAQTPQPANPADSMEPGVNTSSPSQAPAAAPATQPGATPARPAAETSAAANKPATTPAKGAPGAPVKGNAKDRLDLDSSQITGNRELPKVLYVVPWRNAQLGDLVGRPVNSLLDEVLEPVDRDVFRRQNRYFDALQPNQAAPAAKSEK
jgi:hypothetical protein